MEERFFSERASYLIAQMLNMGLSGGWLCYRLGLHENAIKRIYRFERRVSVEELEQLEQYYKILSQLPEACPPKIRSRSPERARYPRGERKDDFRLERSKLLDLYEARISQ